MFRTSYQYITKGENGQRICNHTHFLSDIIYDYTCLYTSHSWNMNTMPWVINAKQLYKERVSAEPDNHLEPKGVKWPLQNRP